MAKHNVVKHKLNAQRMEALSLAYLSVMNHVPEDGHELLLHEHARELLCRISTMLLSDQQKYTLKMSGTEAMAFMQLWYTIPVAAGSLEQVVIGEMIKTIDKASKQPKLLR